MDLQDGDAAGPCRPFPSAPSAAFDAVAAALQRVAAGVEALLPKQAEAARQIRIGQMGTAFPLVSECLASWQEVQTCLAALAKAIEQPVHPVAALLLCMPRAEGAHGDPLAELASNLNALKQTIQARDWIGLADALEYDLGDLAQRWRDALIQPDEAGAPAAPSAPAPARNARVA